MVAVPAGRRHPRDGAAQRPDGNRAYAASRVQDGSKMKEVIKMNALNILSKYALLAAIMLLAAQPALADAPAATGTAAAAKATFGAVAGIVRNSAKLPVAGATVTASRTDGSGVRATVSGSDGLYSFADLPYGFWTLTIQADGYPEATAPAFAVAANQATRVDITVTGSTAVSAAAGAPAAAPAETVPEALQAPEPGPAIDTVTPLANIGYIGWMNGTSREKSPIFDTKFFTPEIRFDMNYLQSANNPKDHTIVGSTEEFRSGEFQIEQVSFGGDFHWNNVHARFLSMAGEFATTTPRNDASQGVGQWDLQGAYKYFSEANAGYHWDVNHGLNVDAGIFVSYIGLFSYYNFDNWVYQPSFVSSNTPWFFNGVRVQYFPTAKLKIEPWFVNGWQSYARANGKPGLGGQILWRPKPWLDLVWNNYGLGEDAVGFPGRSRVHADYSAQVKYYDKPESFIDKMAFTATGDAGCEYGGGPVSFASANGALDPKGRSPEMGTTSTYNGGVNCHNSKGGRPKQAFLGYMFYDRTWFKKDRFALTLGGGVLNNPGRYLTLLPPINGATAFSGSPYFTENAGDRSQMHDGTITFDYMPSQFITFTIEEGYRYSDVPYWSGRGGITPPGGNNGSPAQYACATGVASGFGYGNLTAAEIACGAGENAGTAAGLRAIWWPDLRTN